MKSYRSEETPGGEVCRVGRLEDHSLHVNELGESYDRRGNLFRGRTV